MPLSEEELLQDESAKEYFGFSATEFVTEFRGLVDYYLCEAFKDASVTILSVVVDDKEKVCEALENIRKMYLKKAEKPLKEIEMEVRSILLVPQSGQPSPESADQLPHDNASNEDKEELKKEVEIIEKKIIQKKVFIEALKIRKQQFQQLEPLLDKVSSIIKSTEYSQKQNLLALLDKTISKMNIANKNKDESCVDFQNELQAKELIE